MDIRKLQKNWNEFGETDPLWAILTSPEKKGNKWEIEEFFKTGTTEIELILNDLKQAGINITKERALDFGCGVGRLTQALSVYFDEVYGVDIAPSMIDLAAKYNKCSNKCNYILNASDNLDIFHENNFDFIYTNLVLQHMKPEYSKGYIREFLRVLRPKGILIFQMPSERIKSDNPLKQIIRNIIPSKGIDWIFYLRISLQNMFKHEPMMEMYGIKQDEMVQWLKINGGKILDIKREDTHDSVWISLRYYVTK